jgi:hypothetical protein
MYALRTSAFDVVRAASSTGSNAGDTRGPMSNSHACAIGGIFSNAAFTAVIAAVLRSGVVDLFSAAKASNATCTRS